MIHDLIYEGIITMLLENKLIVITGASRGIGLSVAEKCLFEGARVIADYKNELSGLQSLIEKYGKDKVITIKANVAIASEVQAMIEQIGIVNSCVDGIVCNAGIITRTPDWKDFPLEDWETVIKTNLIGTWNVVRYGVDLMNKGGSIVNVSSIYGMHPEAAVLPYSISKASVNAFTQAISKAIAPNIRINAVMPGNTLTNMVPGESEQVKIEDMTLLNRSANASEIANVIAFLLSDESSYMTGNLIHVDGGFHVI